MSYTVIDSKEESHLYLLVGQKVSTEVSLLNMGSGEIGLSYTFYYSGIESGAAYSGPELVSGNTSQIFKEDSKVTCTVSQFNQTDDYVSMHVKIVVDLEGSHTIYNQSLSGYYDNNQTGLALTFSNLPTSEVPSLVKIKSAENGKFMKADSISNNSLIYCKADENEALIFETQGTEDNMSFRLKDDKYFLSFRDLTGAVKLYDTSGVAYYKVKAKGNTFSIYNNHYKQYMYLDGKEPYVTKLGDPDKASGQWILVPA
jgi:hypothetical protein